MEKVFNQTQVIKRGEIWFADLNFMNTKDTRIQGDFRPIIIIQNNTGNKHSPVVNYIPLTSNVAKCKLPVHRIVPSSVGLKTDSVALVEQQGSLDKNRLLYKIGECDEKTMKQIEEAIMIQIGINNEKQANNEIINEKYIQEILLSIGQLDKLSKETNQPIRAKKVLLEELVKYCKSFGRDYKEVVDEFKKKMAVKNKVEKEIFVCV